MLKKILTKAGHTVMLVSDGVRARLALEDNDDIDVLITDAVMPHLDGRELVVALRREAKWARLPIIMISAFVEPRDVAEILSSGVTRFLAKPVQTKLLLQELSTVLGPCFRQWFVVAAA